MASSSPADGGGAWKTTRQKTRRINLWLKNSLSSLSRSETVFEQAEQEQQQDDDADSNDDNVGAPLCHNIDEAMDSLHGVTALPLDQFQAYTCQEEQDWILDGCVSWQVEQERSKELLNELKGPNLDDLFAQHQTALGRQELDFASFETADFTDAIDDVDDDDFGDFQTAAHDDIPVESQERIVDGEASNTEQDQTEGRASKSQDSGESDSQAVGDSDEKAALHESTEKQESDDAELDQVKNGSVPVSAEEVDEANSHPCVDPPETSPDLACDRKRVDDVKFASIKETETEASTPECEGTLEDRSIKQVVSEDSLQTGEFGEFQTADVQLVEASHDSEIAEEQRRVEQAVSITEEKEESNGFGATEFSDKDDGSCQAVRNGDSALAKPLHQSIEDQERVDEEVSTSKLEKEKSSETSASEKASESSHRSDSLDKDNPDVQATPELENHRKQGGAAFKNDNTVAETPCRLRRPVDEIEIGDARQEQTGSPLHVDTGSVYDRISLTEDVASPEGRFTRRQYLHDKEDEGEADLELPEQYFSDPDWDETQDILLSIPWEHVPILHSNVDPTVVEENLADRLSALDANQAKVKALLTKRACKREHLLTKGNHFIHEMDHNLAMAEMYVERSKDSLSRARGSEEDCTGVEGATMLLKDFDRRDQYESLRHLLDKVARLFDKEQELIGDIESFGTDAMVDYRHVIERVGQLYDDSNNDEDMARLGCLGDLRQRSRSMLGVFRDRIENVLCSYVARLCLSWRAGSDTEYEQMFRAMLTVENCEVQKNEWKECSGESSGGFSERLSEGIRATLCFQADRCFARALLDPSDNTESEYDKDLIHLGYELQQDITCKDEMKLKSLAHNLVTIRFDFESEQNYLPMVYHRLCALLTEILHAHYTLTKNHDALLKSVDGSHKNGPINRDCLERTTKVLRFIKTEIWQRCERVLAQCLDQYHNFAAKKQLFVRDQDDNGTAWGEDLEGLHDVLRLTHQFLSLAHEFLDHDQLSLAQVTTLTCESDSELYSKLCEVFGKHVRTVYIEAMTTIGTSLFLEDWHLNSLEVKAGIDESKRSDAARAQAVYAYLCTAIEEAKCSTPETYQPFWQNELSVDTNSELSIFQMIESRGNPFLLKVERSCDKKTNRNFTRQTSGSNGLDFTTSFEGSNLFTMSSGLFHAEDGALKAFATDSTFKGLMKWFARLLLITQKLPLVAEDVSTVFQNLCDLYFLTAFRLCAGNAKNERIILGLDPATPKSLNDEKEDINSPRSTLHKRQSSSSSGNSFLGFGRRQNPIRVTKPPVFSRNAEADICAPLPSEASEIEHLRHFVLSGQESLGKIVKLEKIEQRLRDPAMRSSKIDAEHIDKVVVILEKRQGAAWGCLFVAALLAVVNKFAEKTLTVARLNQILGTNGSRTSPDADEQKACQSLDSLTAYTKTVSRNAQSLTNLCSRIASVRAILGKNIVEEVVAVGPTWEASRLNEQSSDYVDNVCDRYALTWQSLVSHANGLPDGILKTTWTHLVEGGYISLLEGFSRVPFCSTEGRSLMSMDLASFAVGLDAVSIIDRLDADELIRPPPQVFPSRGMRYVDMYIKVFYYPEEDVMEWIASNFKNYQLNHSLALLTSGASDRDKRGNTDTQKLVQSVQKLYQESTTERTDISDCEQ